MSIILRVLSEEGQNIFSKVSTRSERQRAYNLLVENNYELQVQLIDKKLYRFMPKHIRGSFLVVKDLDTPGINAKADCIVTFSCKGLHCDPLLLGVSLRWFFFLFGDCRYRPPPKQAYIVIVLSSTGSQWLLCTETWCAITDPFDLAPHVLDTYVYVLHVYVYIYIS